MSDYIPNNTKYAEPIIDVTNSDGYIINNHSAGNNVFYAEPVIIVGGSGDNVTDTYTKSEIDDKVDETQQETQIYVDEKTNQQHQMFQNNTYTTYLERKEELICSFTIKKEGNYNISITTKMENDYGDNSSWNLIIKNNDNEIFNRNISDPNKYFEDLLSHSFELNSIKTGDLNIFIKVGAPFQLDDTEVNIWNIID